MQPELTIPLALGRTAEVYAWGENHILKLYRAWCPPHWLEHEAHIAGALAAAGLPTPAVTELVEIDGRRGLVYERVHGISMLDEMKARPWRLFHHARALAELQAQLHGLTLELEALPSYKNSLAGSIRRTQRLPNELREKTLALLETLPDDTRVCHADFHPGNVMLTSRGPVIIDWMTAACGNPWADVARTSLLLQVGVQAAGKMVSPVIRGAVSLYHTVYLNHYHQLRPGGQELLPRWRPVLAAARLDEDIEPEREALLKRVQEVNTWL